MRRLCAYQVDPKWRIVSVNDEFCRALRATAPALIGRDIRELIRQDWQSDFSSYVAKALVGAGDDTMTVPVVRPREDPAWFIHTLEVVKIAGAISGYRAWLVPHLSPRARRWFQRAKSDAYHVWNFELSADES